MAYPRFNKKKKKQWLMISKLIRVVPVIVKRRDVQNHSANKSPKVESTSDLV